ncbi:MAG TPA: type I-U CRISPR-associated protein Cas7, partial [Halothiobacillaceae bacterium]|nr:type I-U CRISPR-associated protein Cas7 [Halothiobacillaceae bacterium]
PRLLIEAKLKPLQGHRFQPTGFADLGPARYTLPDGTEMLLVESVQSVANRMELACWDEAKDDLIEELRGLPYVRVDCGEYGKTNTINEFHRLNSPYIWSGIETDSVEAFREAFLECAGLSKFILRKKGKGKRLESNGSDTVPGVLDFRKFCQAVFKYDPNAVIHGLFLEKVAGRLRMPRLLGGFIEASNVKPAENGGAKVDNVLPSPKALRLSADDGYGNVPFHRTEFVAEEIKVYFNLDLALLRGYNLPEEATQLLIALSLFKIRRFLSTGLRLRTACDLELDGDLVVTRPEGFVLPAEKDLLSECTRLIALCKPRFSDPPITEIEWRPGKKKAGKGRHSEESDEAANENVSDNATGDEEGDDE